MLKVAERRIRSTYPELRGPQKLLVLGLGDERTVE